MAERCDTGNNLTYAYPYRNVREVVTMNAPSLHHRRFCIRPLNLQRRHQAVPRLALDISKRLGCVPSSPATCPNAKGQSAVVMCRQERETRRDENEAESAASTPKLGPARDLCFGRFGSFTRRQRSRPRNVSSRAEPRLLSPYNTNTLPSLYHPHHLFSPLSIILPSINSHSTTQPHSTHHKRRWWPTSSIT